jgi:Holliday junction resolvase RusA-like endonuclease
MNEIVELSKQHWSKYSKLKEQYTQLVALSAHKLPELPPADYTITWYCKNKRQDKDNIMAGQKFIFDGLMAARKLKNDGWKQVRDVTHRFEVDKDNPRVEVEIKEVS